MIGRKDDGADGKGPLKDQWHLMPWGALRQVLQVFMYGAKKYGAFNWSQVDKWQERYGDALERHYVALQEGEKLAADSKLPHLAHIACNALIMLARASLEDSKPTEVKSWSNTTSPISVTREVG